MLLFDGKEAWCCKLNCCSCVTNTLLLFLHESYDKREEFRKQFNKEHPENKAVSAVSVYLWLTFLRIFVMPSRLMNVYRSVTKSFCCLTSGWQSCWGKMEDYVWSCMYLLLKFYGHVFSFLVLIWMYMLLGESAICWKGRETKGRVWEEYEGI